MPETGRGWRLTYVAQPAAFKQHAAFSWGELRRVQASRYTGLFEGTLDKCRCGAAKCHDQNQRFRFLPRPQTFNPGLNALMTVVHRQPKLTGIAHGLISRVSARREHPYAG